MRRSTYSSPSTGTESIAVDAAIVAAILAVVAAGYSARQVVLRRRAERRLLRKLVLDEYQRHASGDAGRIDQIRKEGAFKTAVEQTLDSLDEPDKRQIKEALDQPTKEGRRSYIWELLEEAAEEARSTGGSGNGT